MRVDVMTSGGTWQRTASLAQAAEQAGFSGLVLTETAQTPWMSLATAAMSTSRLALSTGIAVAFARSPMVTAQLAWELAAGSNGRFRLGLGSQVHAHIERRYGAAFEHPGPRLRDYVEAVRDCLAAFRGDRPLDHRGEYYALSLLPQAWRPRPHPYGEINIDVAAVNPWMCRTAAGVADGIHVHPLHSTAYLRDRLLPAVTEGAAESGRSPEQIDLIVPVFAVPARLGQPDARVEYARRQIAFYGSTRNYAFQFDDLGFLGTSARLN
jgi:probable F420-dependent oxidoreductase